MSNPYAPPEDREREAPPVAVPPVPDPVVPAVPVAPAGDPHERPPAGHSPEGVPYERPRTTRQEPPASAADVLRVSALLRWTALLALVAVLGDLLAFPWFLAGGVVAVAALVVGGRGLALATRTRQRSPRTVLILLVAVALLGLTRPGTALVTWDAESTFARCQAGALTVQAQNACVTEYRQALDARVARLKNRTP